MRKAKLGLLPLYIELYDKTIPQARSQIEAFYFSIVDEFKMAGLDVETVEICRLADEFTRAIRHFEEVEVDAIVTLHMAYSPSLESAGALSKTSLPVIILDTTPDFDFGPDQDTSRILYNHGIHGVQDLCNLLIRNAKPFQIEAGHWRNSDVIKRVSDWVVAAQMANQIKTMRVGIIGKPFEGMGDFSVPRDILYNNIGINIVECSPEVIKPIMDGITESEIDTGIDKEKEQFTINQVDDKLLRSTEKVNLAIHKWMEKEKLSAFTFNFLNIIRASGIPAVPFLAASKALAEGYGYAGEGDILTAALIGTLASFYKETTFTEMFCPDWRGNTLYLSHMGEMNAKLAAEKPVLQEVTFPYTDLEKAVIPTGRYKGGEAVLVNLAPGPDSSFTLIIVPVEMQDVNNKDDKSKGNVHGWLKPPIPLAEFLAEYSRIGGTHHSALVYGNSKDGIARFGKMMGWNVKVIE